MCCLRRRRNTSVHQMANLTEIIMDSTNGVFSDYNKHVNINNDIGMSAYSINNSSLFSNDSVADFSTAPKTTAHPSNTFSFGDHGKVFAEFARTSKNMTVPLAIFSSAVLGNVAAIVILTKRPSKDSKSTAFYHLVKVLVLLDLFGNLALTPVTIAVYIKGGIIQTGGMPLCHYFSYVSIFVGHDNFFMVLAMAVERFMVTKFPFQYSRLVTLRSVNYCIAMVWSLSALTALLPVVGLGRNTPHWPGTWCFFDYRSKTVGGQIYSYFYAISGLLAILITNILNVIVAIHMCRIRRHRLITSSVRSSAPATPTNTSPRRRKHDSEKRMIYFLISITLIFSACYVPLMVRIIVNQLFNTHLTEMNDRLDDAMDVWAIRLASMSAVFDPWIYIISRATCCRGSEDRDRVGDATSQSAPSSFNTFTNTTLRSVHLNDNLHRSSTQPTRTSENRILWAIQSASSLFHKRKENSPEKDSATIPLSSLSTCKTGSKSMTSSFAEFDTAQPRPEHSTPKDDSRNDSPM